MDIPVLSLTSEELYCYGYSTDDQLQQLAVLCSDRLTQMTKTYNDIEAVNRLLEEKERDLELAARIGQTLLTKNQELETKNEGLEEHLSAVVDKVNQLKHEVILKDGLLQAFTEYEGGISPCDDSLSDDSLHSSGVKSLQKKCETLEQENVKLKLETAQLSADTYELEEKESKLVNDCLQQFVEVKKDLEHYVEELTKKTEENGAQKEEITNLLGQIVDLQRKVKVQTAENLELQKHLEASQNTQRFLTREISELKDKHDELVALYEDAQEEVRQVRRKQKPGAVRHNYMSSSLLSLPSDSLASELETSLKGDMEYPKGYSPTERKVHNWKVFETVKAAKKSGSRCSSIRSGSHLGASNYSLNDSIESAPVSNRSSMYFSDLESGPSDATGSDLDGLYGTRHSLGRPGIPGSNDLETALRKLSLRRANELNEQDYKEDENKRHRQRSENESSTPGICQTPDSTLSTGSGLSGLSGMTGSSNPYYRLPEKLRIVKPLEGSVTLRQWQQLATPNIGGIFESRPGVQIKGERKLDLEEEQHNLSDLEEDDDYEHFPVRTAQDESWTINTYTNSVVRHPSCYLSEDEQCDSDLESLTDTSTPLVCSPRMASQHAPNVGSIPVQGAGLGLASLLGASDLLPQNLNRENTEKTKTNNSNYTAGVTSGSYTDETHNLDKNFSVTDNRRVNCSTVPSSDRYIFHNQMKSVPSDVLHNKSETENFMSKIKNTGSSLYGFLGNWGQSSQTSTDVTTTNSSAIGTLPVSNMTDRATNDNSAGSNVTIISTNDKSPTKSSMVSSIFGQRAGGSVLGALTSFQRSGIL
ncbi:trafficking kinesin-binding protein 1-like isoform X1 [Mytilus edulis]|uniref:trafficking kinesin-binding protein 1-like isoform X1 n=2 Tax=Mytilus edulis TaxID=6550 RepID=UPI0039F06F9C